MWAPFRSLLGAQAASALLGLVFWVTVARLVPAHGVGVATAAISTQTLLGLFCSLGLGTFLVAELPAQGAARQRTLLLRSLLVSAAVAVVAAGVVVAAVGASGIGGALGEALSDPARAAAFVAGSVAAVWVAVLDEAVLGLRRSGVQVTRNLVASLLRFPLAGLLLLAGSRDALALQVCWVLPLLVSVAVAWRVLRLPTAGEGPSLRADISRLHAPALHHYRLNLAIAACTQLVPVAAALTLETRENAAFAIAWLLATFAFLPPYLLAVSLFAHGAGEGPAALRVTMRQTIVVALGLSLVICAGAWTLGRPVLSIFGGGYADTSYVVLALLVPAGAWMVVKDHLVALWRSEKRFHLATRLASVALMLELAGAAGGGVLDGARGLAVGWLAAMVLEALLLAPVARRLVRPVGPPRDEHDERGRATGTLVVGVLLAVAGLVVGALLVTAILRAVDSDEGDEPVAASGATTLRLCRPTADRPGPLVDLGVTTSTGIASSPHLRPLLVDRLVTSAAGAGADVVSATLSWSSLQPPATGAVDFR
ncbi:MAG: oligosaccharide flippase family protein, partial [Rhodoferax sp.]|nr:oligosaccharide flippase family protein [Actinomycetota bacterium]